MSLTINHTGIKGNVPIDPTFNGASPIDTIAEQLATAYIQSLVAGAVVGQDANGYVQLAEPGTVEALGFLVLNAAGGFYENVPALGSLQVAVIQGNSEIITDQTSVPIVAGDQLYADNATPGFLTNVLTSNGRIVGIAKTSAGAGLPVTVATL